MNRFIGARSKNGTVHINVDHIVHMYEGVITLTTGQTVTLGTDEAARVLEILGAYRAA